ncbi:hypothetical protein B0T10DRAFT_548667 [Thelonectria olida]|uniref:Uncharacterized protein n=1 Tax=Thelonectria olida TaxID=1576542 RepID=A0A9P8W3D2_9HYPO|nr:hypothetical protein B0T10DRAFT_548667 [Thelonectria olida]
MTVIIFVVPSYAQDQPAYDLNTVDEPDRLSASRSRNETLALVVHQPSDQIVGLGKLSNVECLVDLSKVIVSPSWTYGIPFRLCCVHCRLNRVNTGGKPASLSPNYPDSLSCSDDCRAATWSRLLDKPYLGHWRLARELCNSDIALLYEELRDYLFNYRKSVEKQMWESQSHQSQRDSNHGTANTNKSLAVSHSPEQSRPAIPSLSNSTSPLDKDTRPDESAAPRVGRGTAMWNPSPGITRRVCEGHRSLVQCHETIHSRLPPRAGGALGNNEGSSVSVVVSGGFRGGGSP